MAFNPQALETYFLNHISRDRGKQEEGNCINMQEEEEEEEGNS